MEVKTKKGRPYFKVKDKKYSYPVHLEGMGSTSKLKTKSTRIPLYTSRVWGQYQS